MKPWYLSTLSFYLSNNTSYYKLNEVILRVCRAARASPIPNRRIPRTHLLRAREKNAGSLNIRPRRRPRLFHACRPGNSIYRARGCQPLRRRSEKRSAVGCCSAVLDGGLVYFFNIRPHLVLFHFPKPVSPY